MDTTYRFTRLSPVDKLSTVFHCWILLKDGKNPLRNQNVIAKFLKKIKDASFRYSVDIIDIGIADNHIHMALAQDAGPRNISKFWKSLNTFLALQAKRQGIEGKIFVGQTSYRAISSSYELLVVSRYIHNNGKEDGHFMLYSTEREYLYMNFDMVNIKATRRYLGVETDDIRSIMAASKEEFGKIIARYAPAFKKRKHLFRVGGKPEPEDF